MSKEAVFYTMHSSSYLYLPKESEVKILAFLKSNDEGNGVTLNSRQLSLLEKNKLPHKKLVHKVRPKVYRLTDHGKKSIAVFNQYKKLLTSVNPEMCCRA